MTITGGFVTAAGGGGVSDISIGPGAAIGYGGAHQSTTPGAEIDVGNFTNCVVLRQSANTSDQMVGQVYGSSTLTTNAELPAGKNLLIPEGSTLTVDTGTTLTNSGAIYVDGTLGSSVSGDGTIYYPLTVAGGTANNSGTADLAFALATDETVQYAGDYFGTVTFTVAVETVSATP